MYFEENYRLKVEKLQFWQNLHLEKFFFLDWNSPPFLGEMGGGKTLLFLKKRFLHLQDINFLFGQLEIGYLKWGCSYLDRGFESGSPAAISVIIVITIIIIAITTIVVIFIQLVVVLPGWSLTIWLYMLGVRGGGWEWPVCRCSIPQQFLSFTIITITIIVIIILMM